MRNKKRYNSRRSIRLQGYDYSSTGEYFVTICTKNRECFYGDVRKGKVALSEIGLIAHDLWYQIPERFDGISLDSFIVMPNHIHGIVGIEYNPEDRSDPVVTANHDLQLQQDGLESIEFDIDPESYRKKRRNMLLPKIIGWYKMNVSKKANLILQNTGNPFWHRNYYEHIVRNKESLERIRDYINDNPKKWDEDINHPKNIK